MSEHNKIQLYVGLEEGGCVDVGAIKLAGFTLIETNALQDLKEERDALAAQVEALRREIQSAADWFSAYWPELNKAQCDRIRQMDRVAKATPQQHLAEIRAQAVIDAINVGFTPEQFHALKKSRDCIDLQADAAIKGWWACWEWVDSDDRDKLTLIPAADQYADSIRQGGAE